MHRLRSAAVSTDRALVLGDGGTVAAQMASGLPLQQLWARQADPAHHAPELASPGMSLTEWMDTIARLAEQPPHRQPVERLAGRVNASGTASGRVQAHVGFDLDHQQRLSERVVDESPD